MKKLIQKMRNKIANKLSDEKGSLLLISYLAIVVLLGIGAAFLLLATSEARTSERHRLTAIAFHIAEAGVERGLYDLRQDFVLASGIPSWSDGDIHGFAIGPDTNNYYTIPYVSTSLNGGSYTVQLKNITGTTGDIWVKSAGTINGVTHTIEIYVKMVSQSPWDYAIFAGSGQSGLMINGNVDIRGSVLVLGSGLNPGDYAIDMGGTAQLVGNNYTGLAASLLAKVPALPTKVFNGETVSTLNGVLRVKKGLVGVSGSATVGEPNIAGNGTKETVDAVYVTDGYGGNQGAGGVYSDNGNTNAYDLGDAVTFPSLSTPYNGFANYKTYLKTIGYTLTAAQATAIATITPTSSFSYGDANGSISMSGGSLTINGVVVLDNGATLSMAKQGANNTITYSGKGSLYVDGNVQVDVNVVTTGNNSYPTNIMGIMTPGQIGFNEASIDVMGVFYGETKIKVEKQTDIMGSIVSNYFDLGTNVPSIFQVPTVAQNLPPGMIGGSSRWYMVVAWIKS